MLQGISLKKGEKEKEKARHRDQSSDEAKVFYSTLCRYLCCLTRIAIFSRDKIKTYKLSRKHEVINMKDKRVVNNHFYHMVHKKRGYFSPYRKTNEGNAWILQPPGYAWRHPLLLILNKEQRIPDRSKTAHRKPLVKCFLTV